MITFIIWILMQIKIIKAVKKNRNKEYDYI